MSQLEAARSLTLGQYLPVDSPIHRLDARAKMVAYVLLVLALTFAPRPLGLAVGLGWVLLGLLLARIPLGYALRGLLPPLPFLLVLAVFQFFIPCTGDTTLVLFQWGSFELTLARIIAAGMLLLRFACLILALSLSSFTISNSELIQGLGQLLAPFGRLGLPVEDWVMAVQVMLRFLPLLAQVAERIAKAQAARGAVWGTRKGGLVRRARQVVPLIIPLFILALRRAENMALAMEARAYQQRSRTVAVQETHFGWAEIAYLILSLGIAGLMVWL